MSRIMSEDQWRPVGVRDLETNAMTAVRSQANKLVVAGPGAGKTELLAQRAHFLLTTGRCPAPRRILAISFKRDAASNLAERVRERCGDLAERFDSFTLDAFAKGLVDRFRLGLPPKWRPRPGYNMRPKEFRAEEARRWMERALVPSGLHRPNMRRWSKEKIRKKFSEVTHGARLPYDEEHLDPIVRVWGLQWWKEVLAAPPDAPSITFPMLNRLAAYLLRCNPKIVRALHKTYTHLFMDEFQDTTGPQWDLVTAAFQHSPVVVTAVGDNKQRIMLWAGAMSNAFERIQADFGTRRLHLVRNYRSAPQLVDIQNRIARTVERDAMLTETAGDHVESGTCAIWKFADARQEAEWIADWIAGEIAQGKAEPEDFAILVRQTPRIMIDLLRQALAKRGHRLRDESKLQDLRVEPLTKILLPSLRLAVRQRDAEAWSALVNELAWLTGLDEERDETALETLAKEHRDAVAQCLHEGDGSLRDAPWRVIDVLGADRYRGAYPQYASEEYFAAVVENIGRAWQDSLDYAGNAQAAVDEFMGVGVTPAMTIHKSKGLEFDTVLFLGLEDEQWWNFRNQPDEDKRAFFVAFSRAKRRVFFTFSQQRPVPQGPLVQKHDDIDTLYQILRDAGVPTIHRAEDVGP